MSKGSGNTRGGVISRGKNVKGFTTIFKSLGGSSYQKSLGNDFYLNIETENGYAEDYGEDGTKIIVTLEQGLSSGNFENIAVNFVNNTPFKESGNRNVYDEDKVVKTINKLLPYYEEVAQKLIKNKKSKR